ncbi:MAG: cobalamin B12-binding domain-containing protein, partial [Deltaproteobacteria bacterium]|nr:cobalamin B12-binding domain-containing protein [Deltaproteobacteria bacterium]
MSETRHPRRVAPYRPRQRVRVVTATSLFDGHDATINIMRRILQASGAEVIHLGHNRSVEEIVRAAVQEDVQAIAVTSYQGGHLEFFGYMLELLREGGGERVKVFGGGGGVIVPAEIRALHALGVERIYSPEDGAAMGLQGMINDLLERCDVDPCAQAPVASELVPALRSGDRRLLARAITGLENGVYLTETRQAVLEAARALASRAPALGVTGTGGAGKSSLADELVRRFRLDQDDRLHIAVISIDPSRKRTGGALLGDRIRMNALLSERIYMRSMATRRQHVATKAG